MSEKLTGMVDVSAKERTTRVAEAEVRVLAPPELLDRVEKGDTPKGEVIPVARAAALMAAKSTHLVFPHCHPLDLSCVELSFEREPGALRVVSRVTALERTGVEMEALYAASVAALTIYDMAKFAGLQIRVDGLGLILKRGGKSDFARSASRP
jgi:cyclic pyranopterin monophosphate synthase